MKNTRIFFWGGLSLVVWFILSCKSISEPRVPVVNYDKMLFSNGEHTTKLSVFEVIDTSIDGTLDSGFCQLCGTIFVRDGLEKYSGELYDNFIFLGSHSWPHLVIPSLNLDIEIKDGSFCKSIPLGTYDIIIYSAYYYPVHLLFEFKNKHKYSINFYLGYTSIH